MPKKIIFQHEEHQEGLDPEREVRSPMDFRKFRDLAKYECILAATVVEVRAEVGRLLSLRRVRYRGRVDRHAAGPTPPSQSVQLSMVCTLAPSAPPEELAAGEHRSAGLLPCSRVTDPWGRRAQPQWPVEVPGAQHRVHPAFSSSGFKKDLRNAFSEFY